MKKFLKSLGIITLNPIKVEKKKFFVTGENETTKLWMSENFKDIFLPLVGDTIDYKGGQLEKLKIAKSCNGFQIKEERDNALIQSPDDIVGQIASLTSSQPKGEKGNLLANGYASYFYFEIVIRRKPVFYYVGVAWLAVDRVWRCYCYPVHSPAWNAGSQVLYPITQDVES